MVLASGVLMNFLFAWLIYVTVFTTGVTASTAGFERYATRFHDQRVMVSSVLPGSPAEKVGINTGDVLISVASSTDRSIAGFQGAVNDSHGRTILISYEHDGNIMSAPVTPVPGLVEGKYAIGVAMDNVADLRLPFVDAIREGLSYTINLTKATVTGLYALVANIFHGTPNFSDVSGPIGIAGIVGNAATLGLSYLLMVTAIISINLGVVNLIPFPALDGGRILFVALEGTFRRRIPAGFANTVNAIGFGLLMILMVAVTWKDIAGMLK
jgi:regulator of sigma E protease